MSARPLEGHPIAPRAHGSGRHQDRRRPVHREERRDAVLVFSLGEQEADPAQVAGAFLAHIADEKNVAPGFDFGDIQSPDIGQHNGQRVSVVTHARGEQFGPLPSNLHFGLFREHCVQMRCHDHKRRADGACPPAQAHHIALGVHLDIAEAGSLQHGHVGLSLGRLLEGRGRDLGQADGFLDDAVVLAIKVGGRRLESRAVADRLDGLVGCGGLSLRVGHAAKRKGGHDGQNCAANVRHRDRILASIGPHLN